MRADIPFTYRPRRVPGFLFILVHGVRRRNILQQHKTQLSEHNTHQEVLDYTTHGTHLLVVVSVIFNFLAARFRVALHGLLGRTRMLASRLAGFSTITGMLGNAG
jgi:hypothetical protein